MFRCRAGIEFLIINGIFFFSFKNAADHEKVADGVTYIGDTEIAMSMAMVCRSTLYRSRTNSTKIVW